MSFSSFFNPTFPSSLCIHSSSWLSPSHPRVPTEIITASCNVKSFHLNLTLRAEPRVQNRCRQLQNRRGRSPSTVCALFLNLCSLCILFKSRVSSLSKPTCNFCNIRRRFCGSVTIFSIVSQPQCETFALRRLQSVERNKGDGRKM